MADLSGYSDDQLIQMLQSHPDVVGQGSGVPQLRTEDTHPITDSPNGPANPNPSGPAPASPTTGARRSDQIFGFSKGVLTPILNAGVGIEKTLGAVGIPSINKMLGGKSAQEVHDEYQQYVKDREAVGDEPGAAGEIIGGTLATAPVMFATRNPFLLGGATGALQSEGNTAHDVAGDAVGGALMGKAADLGLKTAGAVIAPRFKPAVNALLSRGVKLTPGQIIGGSAHRVEDVATSVLGLGDVVSGAQRRSLASFNTAAANKVLEHIGEEIPPTVKPGHDSIAYLQDRLGQEYDRITPQMRIKPDSQLNSDLSAIVQHAAQNLPKEHSDLLTKLVNNEVSAPIATGARGTATLTLPGQNPTATGDMVKTIDGVVNSARQRYGVSSNPHDQLFSQYLAAVKSAVHSAAERQNPALAKQLSKVDDAYADLTRLEPAAAASKDGLFTPDQLATATRKMDPTIRKRASAAGSARMQDLAEAGRATISRTIGESGTASRAAINAGIGAALYGTHALANVNPMALAAVGSAVLPYTRAGGAVARAVMTRRPAVAPLVRRGIEAVSPAVQSAVVQTTTKNRNASRMGQ